MKRLIVGVDPGLTCGLAILSLDGTPLLVSSRREWPFSSLIQIIAQIGEPTIISSDVSPAPEMLEKLSQTFSSVLFTPLISMGTDEKHDLARNYVEHYDFKTENTHEIDALAAAIKAYQHYRNKFRQVDARIKKAGLKISADDVKDLIVRGQTMNRAIQIVLSPDKPSSPQVVSRTVPREERLKNLVIELRKRMVLEKEIAKKVRALNRELRTKIKDSQSEIGNLQEKIIDIRRQQKLQIKREREYQILQDEVNSLRNEILKQSIQLDDYKKRFDRIQRLRELESQGKLVLLKPIETFTKEGLEKAYQLYGIRAGDYVFLLDPSGGGASTAQSLSKRGIRAVITVGPMSHQAKDVFVKYMVPTVSSERIIIEWFEGLPYAHSEGLKKVFREFRDSEDSRALDRLKTIIEDHRKELGN